MPAKSTDSPAVDFNFDTWEQKDQPEPFGVVAGGKRYEAVSPLEVDFRELEAAATTESGDEMFRLLFPDDYQALYENTLRMGAVVDFMQKVMEHYGLGNGVAP